MGSRNLLWSMIIGLFSALIVARPLLSIHIRIFILMLFKWESVYGGGSEENATCQVGLRLCMGEVERESTNTCRLRVGFHV